MHFRKSGRFFTSSKKCDRTEQGAGELGPLGSARELNLLSKKQSPKTILVSRKCGDLVRLFLTRFRQVVVAQT